MSKAVKAVAKVIKKATSVVTGDEQKRGAPVVPGAKKVAGKEDEAAKAKQQAMDLQRRQNTNRRRTILSSENLG